MPVAMAMPMVVGMTMIVPMPVLMRMIMTVIVVVMRMAVIMRMVMVVSVAMPRLGVGALLRGEGCGERGHARAQSLEHRHDHVIVPDAQPAGQDLDGQMTVAQMPGEPRQGRRAFRRHVADPLVGGRHLDDVAGVQDQSVARAEDAHAGQVEQERRAVVGRERDAAAMAMVEVERRTPDPALAGPGAGRHRFDGAAHGQNRK